MLAKGSNMHHMRTFVLREHGADGWERVLGALAPDEAAAVRAVLPVAWYPLATQHLLLRTIDRTLGAGDGELARVIGRYEADQDLTIVHRLFLRMANPAFVLEKAGDYWSRFYEAGTWTVTRGDGGTSARGELREVEPTDELFCLYLEAYVMRMFELVGAKEVRGSHSRCRCRGAEACVFEGRWS